MKPSKPDGTVRVILNKDDFFSAKTVLNKNILNKNHTYQIDNFCIAEACKRFMYRAIFIPYMCIVISLYITFYSFCLKINSVNSCFEMS